ncbi:MAG: T9SS type A sorting domain-containing protein [Ignavibacteria bacterium]|nr:T9SS type A sorting domain-containing protein [Ignavibacteria bacterium]
MSSEAWTKAGFVNGNGTSASTSNYSFSDRGLSTGIYKYRLKQIDYNGNYQYYDLQSEVVIGAPTEFSLKQNYPNPFNPTTKISFDIKNDAFVSMKLFDINGREIKTLVNEFKNSGYYSIDLDASELSSGAYLYRIESGNFVSTKKLVVLR